MFEAAASFLLGVFAALIAVAIYWMAYGRFRHQPLAEERYKAVLNILLEALSPEKKGGATLTAAFTLGAPVVDLLIEFVERSERSPEETSKILCDIICATRKDLGLLPIEKDKIARILRLDPYLRDIKR